MVINWTRFIETRKEFETNKIEIIKTIIKTILYFKDISLLLVS